MGENSKIEWCDHTFNPWIGCTKLSAACDNCYAEKERAVTCLGVTWGAGAPRHRTAASTWKQPLSWNRKAEKEGRRARVFCASLADVFDAEVPDSWRDDLFALIAATPHLDWLLLTKRPKVMRDYLTALYDSADGLAGWLNAAARLDAPDLCAQLLDRQRKRDPISNVWLGTTVEDQKMADLRIPLLLETPAAVRFLSMEPTLGMVDLRSISLGKRLWLDALTGFHCGRSEVGTVDHCLSTLPKLPGATAALDWIITGGCQTTSRTAPLAT